MSEDKKRMRVQCAYGDAKQDTFLFEIESVRFNIPAEDQAAEAMILLAEAATHVAKRYDVHRGYRLPI